MHNLINTVEKCDFLSWTLRNIHDKNIISKFRAFINAFFKKMLDVVFAYWEIHTILTF